MTDNKLLKFPERRKQRISEVDGYADLWAKSFFAKERASNVLNFLTVLAGVGLCLLGFLIIIKLVG